MMDRDFEADLAGVEAELEELIEERRRELARPMRGAVREQLRRQFDRGEARLRTCLAALADQDRPAVTSSCDKDQ